MEPRQSWSVWLRRQAQIAKCGRAGAGRKARSRALVLETLEDRTVPTSATTNFFAHPIGVPSFAPQTGQGSGSGGVFLPPDIQTAYGLNSLLAAGNNGAGQTIALIDAYNDPTISSDLTAFSTLSGLPQLNSTGNGTFKVVNQSGGTTLPGNDPNDRRGSVNNPGWPLEESLDVEWAHAIAPGANIILVEATNNSDANLNAAADWAAKSVANGGGGAAVVSMSFATDGGDSGETGEDGNFSAASFPGVTFVASAGDDGSVNAQTGRDATNGQAGYPADSPNVVAVGGTSLTLTGTDSAGNYNPYSSESVWNDGLNSRTGLFEATGGGISSFETQPSYQVGLVIHNGASTISANGMRAAPDVSFLADPNTGVLVLDSFDAGPGGGFEVGGTSLSSPAWAGLFAISDQIRASHGLTPLSGSTQTLPTLYQMATNSTVYANDFHDITTGNNNNSSNSAGFAAGPGYDLVTGLGTPIANNLLPDLAGAVVTSVSSTAPNNIYGIGASIPITIRFDTSVTVTGTPLLMLNSGGVATYSSGSGTNNLVFNYVVGAGDNTSHLDFSSISALTLNGGTISVTGSTPVLAADLSLMPPAATGSLGANTNIVINTGAASPPQVTGISPNSGPTAGGTKVTITGAGFTATSTVKFGSIAGTGVTFLSSTSLTAVSPAGENPGAVDVIVTTVGGASTTSSSDQFTFVAPPSVTGVSPASGPTAGGTTVTITGAGFTAASTVMFGSIAGTGVVVNSPNSITAVSPAGETPGSVDVVVTTLGGASTTSSSDQFTFVAAPTVTGLTPASGPIAGGTTVTVTGTGFTPASTVKFGSVAGTGVVFVSSTSLTAVSPAEGPGAVDVTVTTVGGASTTNSSDQFTFLAVPTVTGVSPNSGPVIGSTFVTITGTGFTPASTVMFGSKSGVSVAFVSSTSLTAFTPAQNDFGVVDVIVTTPGGSSTANPSDQINFFFHSLAPTSGSGQVSLLNTTFAAPLVATLADNAGNPISGVTVTFTPSFLGAGVTYPNGNTAVTNAQGQVSVVVVANGIAGSYLVGMSAPGLSLSGSYTLTNTNNQPTDPGFETPAEGAGVFAYGPTGSPWTFTGSAGLAGNQSGISSGNPNAPQGSQAAFIQRTSSISQGFALVAGTYTLSFDAAQRGNQFSDQTFQVLVDGAAVGTFNNLASTAYAQLTTSTFTVTAGVHTVTFQGTDLNGGDNTVFLDQVTINQPPQGLADPGFETPAQGSGQGAFAYAPTGSPWTFSGPAGVAGNRSAFTSGNPNAPQGSQVAFIQGSGSVSQSFSFASGSYVIDFDAAQRGNQFSDQTFQVLVDGVAVGTFNNFASTAYAQLMTSTFTATAGVHTLTFQGTNINGGDNTILLDQVTLSQPPQGLNDPGFETPAQGSGAFA